MIMAEYEVEAEKYVEEDQPFPKRDRFRTALDAGILHIPSNLIGDDTIRAAGGWTAPAETRYDFLPEIRAVRGGITYDGDNYHFDNTEAEPEVEEDGPRPALVDIEGIREVQRNFGAVGRVPVGIIVGDNHLTQVGSIEPTPASLARLLRMVADGLDG